ncbi:MAG: hypothetical protein GYB66_04165 [Chloroflexi bacterium]|nr:hypothetical protein [Chloroflexota bacterium]
MSEEPAPEVRELLKEGINAARAGDKDKAREAFRKVVELDQYNEQGWFWLASVVETEEERRTCLGNVVLINPENLKAQRLLEQLEGSVEEEGRAIEPAQRKRLMFLAVGAAGLIGICILLLIVFVGGGDDGETAEVDEDTTAAGTSEDADPAQQSGESGTTAPGDLVQSPADETASPGSGLDEETVTSLPTETVSQRPTLPPQDATVTPTPSPEGPPTLPPPPESLTGRILLGSGDPFTNKEYLPIYIMSLDSPSELISATQNQARGAMPSFAPSGNRYIFAQFNTGQRSVTLQVLNVNGTNSRTLPEYWNFAVPILDQTTPAWSPVDNRVAFVGSGLGSRQSDLYVVDVPETPPPAPGEIDAPEPTTDEDSEGTEEPGPGIALPPSLSQLTRDAVNELWPAWSPDGTRLVYVADTGPTGTDGVDLRVIDVASGTIQFLTADRLAVVESAPSWGGPENNLVVYSGTAEGDNQSDIWIVSLDALTASLDTEIPPEAEPTLLIDLGPNDVQPRWSPDGQYILFSSDAFENYDVYVYEYATGEIFALTNTPEVRDIANDWIIP